MMMGIFWIAKVKNTPATVDAVLGGVSKGENIHK